MKIEFSRVLLMLVMVASVLSCSKYDGFRISDKNQVIPSKKISEKEFHKYFLDKTWHIQSVRRISNGVYGDSMGLGEGGGPNAFTVISKDSILLYIVRDIRPSFDTIVAYTYKDNVFSADYSLPHYVNKGATVLEISPERMICIAPERGYPEKWQYNEVTYKCVE